MDKYVKVLITSSVKRLMSARELESRYAEDPSQYKEEFDNFLASESKRCMEEYSEETDLAIVLDNLADMSETRKASEELKGLINEQGE